MKGSVLMLKNLYIFFFIVIAAAIILHPWVLEKNLPAIDREKEEILEVVLTGALIGLGYFIYILYKREIENKRLELEDSEKNRSTLEDRLDQAFKHIGQVNVQIQEVKAILSGFKKYPESKNEFNNILRYFSDKILGIAAVDCVLIKIVDLASFNTLGEHSQCREGAAFSIGKIGNKNLIDEIGLEPYKVVSSNRNDLKIKIYCLMPKAKISRQAEMFIEAIINQMEMIFLIFSSNYYKSGKDNNSGKV